MRNEKPTRRRVADFAIIFRSRKRTQSARHGASMRRHFDTRMQGAPCGAFTPSCIFRATRNRRGGALPTKPFPRRHERRTASLHFDRRRPLCEGPSRSKSQFDSELTPPRWRPCSARPMEAPVLPRVSSLLARQFFALRREVRPTKPLADTLTSAMGAAAHHSSHLPWPSGCRRRSMACATRCAPSSSSAASRLCARQSNCRLSTESAPPSAHGRW
jgi:hypothetical protein